MNTSEYMKHATFLESTEDRLVDILATAQRYASDKRVRGSYATAVEDALKAIRKARVNATAEALIAYQEETRQYTFDVTPARYPGDPKGESYGE